MCCLIIELCCDHRVRLSLQSLIHFRMLALRCACRQLLGINDPLVFTAAAAARSYAAAGPDERTKVQPTPHSCSTTQQL